MYDKRVRGDETVEAEARQLKTEEGESGGDISCKRKTDTAEKYKKKS